MKKIVLTFVVVIVVVLNSAFLFWEKKDRSPYIQQPNTVYTVEQYPDDSDYIPGYGNTFLGFKEAIAFKESQGRYNIINSLGYLGKYQFGTSTLSTLRISNMDYFLYSSVLQEKAFLANCSYNKWLLHDEITQNVGSTINGIQITESGIIAAAHLAGAGSVKRFLQKKGKSKRIVDAFGTSLEQYLRKFADYDLSFVKPTRFPVLNR